MNLMYVAVICALIGLVFAFVLTKRVNSVDAGTDRMKEIASAIAEGSFYHRWLLWYDSSY